MVLVARPRTAGILAGRMRPRSSTQRATERLITPDVDVDVDNMLGAQVPRNLRSAMRDHIASTTPKGQAPDKKP